MVITSALADHIPIHFPPPVFIAPREVPCEQALKPYFDWASGATPAREDRRGVQFSLVYNQNRNPNQPGLDQNPSLAGYTIGGLTLQGAVLQGDAVASFSDRTFCPPGSTGFCSTAPFNPNAVDKQGITLAEDGTLTFVLKSWGNSVYVDHLVCMDNGVFYAPSKTGSRSMSIVTLQKTGFVNPR